jgi:hypothetical protein
LTAQRSNSQKVLLACGFAGLLFVAAYLLLGSIAPDYHPLRDTISSLEFTSLGAGQRANFLVFGLLQCAFAAGLRRELLGGRGALLIPFVQSVAGVGVIGDAIFIHAPPHLVCDLIAFNSALLVLFLFAWRFRREPYWNGWTAYSILTAITMMAFLLAFGFANHLGGPAGLMEKLATVTRSLWSALFVMRLFGGHSLQGR